MTCDPCTFCIHLVDDSDESVGMYGYDCDSPEAQVDDWEPGCGRPCPGFSPIPSTLTLMEQLYEDACYLDWLEEQEGEF